MWRDIKVIIFQFYKSPGVDDGFHLHQFMLVALDLLGFQLVVNCHVGLDFDLAVLQDF